MPDNQFDILIKFGLDKDKATQAIGELESLKRGQESAGKAAEVHGNHIQGLHKAYGFLARQFGEIGHLVHFMFNPVTLAIGLLAEGIHKVSEHFEALKKKAEETQKKLEGFNLTRINALRDAAIESGSAVSKLNDELARAGQSTDPLAGDKSLSPEAELARRSRLQPGYAAAAAAAAQRAEEWKNSPRAKELAKILADAQEAQPGLLKAKNDANRGPSTTEIIAAGAMGLDPKEFIREAKRKAQKAKAEYDANEARITDVKTSLKSFDDGHTHLSDDAAAKKAMAVGNMSAMTTLGESITQTEIQRKRALIDQLQAGGFGLTQASQMVGAGAAYARISSGGKATGMEAADYNAMLSQVKATMAASFFKSLNDAFSDGIVTREEMDQFKSRMKNQSNPQ